MDSRLSETSAALKSCKHTIWGVQLSPDNLKCLQDGAKMKVPGALLNVVGALRQVLGDQNGISDFAIFSTWLSPLISRKVKQGAYYGTIAGHIQDATFSLLSLLRSLADEMVCLTPWLREIRISIQEDLMYWEAWEVVSVPGEEAQVSFLMVLARPRGPHSAILDGPLEDAENEPESD
ncbi:hypothetical protein B0H13DRAFT_1850937 [Mycena leptocephala]|nr:hypothetical protein B0H13DRAFT_1850937 [Mycena leptocephala]